MKAIIITQPGAPEVLQVQERSKPVILAGEVLVHVAAAGVNRPDVAQRKGNYPPPKAPLLIYPDLKLQAPLLKWAAM